MGDYIQVLALIVAGILLFWFGYSMFFGPLSPFYPGWFPWSKWGKKADYKGTPGDPQVCPICSSKLARGEHVKTLVFPSMSGGRDRLTYIKGCLTCLNNNVQRRCPVCGIELGLDDYLVSRMFERTNTRSHIHVFGCNHCKNMGTLAK
jgi:hypothetical protein